MAKLTLNPAPTFKAPVLIPVPGAASVSVEFIFRHRTREGFEQYLEEIKALDGKPQDNDVGIVMRCITGWELDDPFGEDSVRLLVGNYHGAAYAIAETYARQLLEGRTKN